MRHMLMLATCLGFTLTFSCTKDILFEPRTIFAEYWTFVDENYIFFDAKGVDWDSVYTHTMAQIDHTTTEDDLFALTQKATLALKDSHSWLYRNGEYAASHNYRETYEIHFDPQLVKQRYVQDSLGQYGQLYVATLEQGIGYIYWPEFVGYGELTNVLFRLKADGAQKIIIDVRGNGGGDSNDIPEMLGHLVQEKTYLGSYIEKMGPAHNDISQPVPVHAKPKNTALDLPIVVLTNRACYSATSYFAAMIKGLPQVTLIGQVTGGGSGGNLGYQLSNGWLVAVSVSDFLDNDGRSIEVGVQPDILIQNTAADIANGRDLMLEAAIAHED